MKEQQVKKFLEQVKLESTYKKFIKSDIIYELINTFNDNFQKQSYSSEIENPLKIVLQFYKEYNIEYYNKIIEGIKNNNVVENENTPTITITRENNIDKMEISDYMLVGDYVKIMEKQGEYSLLDKICNSVLWNNSKQKINKGTYYVITNQDCSYNILINSDKIRISRRTKVKLDVESKKENITLENLLRYNINTNSYGFTVFKHDKIGSTFFHKYYNKNSTIDLGELELSKEESYEKIEEFIAALESCDEIRRVLDIDLLKTNILDDLKNELNQAKKILPN